MLPGLIKMYQVHIDMIRKRAESAETTIVTLAPSLDAITEQNRLLKRDVDVLNAVKTEQSERLRSVETNLKQISADNVALSRQLEALRSSRASGAADQFSSMPSTPAATPAQRKRFARTAEPSNDNVNNDDDDNDDDDDVVVVVARDDNVTDVDQRKLFEQERKDLEEQRKTVEQQRKFLEQEQQNFEQQRTNSEQQKQRQRTDVEQQLSKAIDELHAARASLALLEREAAHRREQSTSSDDAVQRAHDATLAALRDEHARATLTLEQATQVRGRGYSSFLFV